MAHCGSKKMKYGGSVKKMKGGGPATPTVLPKRKPKATATSTNRKTGATRGAGDDKEYMRKAAAANMEDGGKVISDADKNRIRNIFQQPKNILDEIGKTISDADRKKGIQRPRKKFTDLGRGISDADRKKIIDLMGMEDGGAVPKKYKGFSKLPERVQQKINPDLAGKYEDGGEVRGMGRAYQGKPRGCKIR